VATNGFPSAFRIEVDFAGGESRLQRTIGQDKPFPSDFWVCPQLDRELAKTWFENCPLRLRSKKRRVPKWNQGVVGLSILTLAVAGTLLFPQAQYVAQNNHAAGCWIKTWEKRDGRRQARTHSYCWRKRLFIKITARILRSGENEESLPQPSVHIVASYRKAYDSNPPNQHSANLNVPEHLSGSVPVAT
jgi:hypothetical protein